MKLENQLVSLVPAKQMKDLGFKQDSLFYWESFSNKYITNGYKIIQLKKVDTKEKHYSAYTVAELGEMLPRQIKNNNGLYTLRIIARDNGKGFALNYRDAFGSQLFGHSERIIEDKTEANARAKMLIYLKENKLV